MLDSKGQRVAAFGKFAGVAGAVSNDFYAWVCPHGGWVDRHTQQTATQHSGQTWHIRPALIKFQNIINNAHISHKFNFW